MKPKLGIIDKYRPLWEGGKSVEKYNIKVGFKIRMFVVSQITSQRQKNPNILSQKDIEQLTNMIMELKQDKATIPLEEQTCSLEDYQKFLFDFFSKVDYEDRHETVTIKTTSKFRLMASFIDVLSSWGPIDEEMIKCKKYCQFKAVDIFKELKKGEIPKRGGPKEQLDEKNGNNNINEEKNNIKEENNINKIEKNYNINPPNQKSKQKIENNNKFNNFDNKKNDKINDISNQKNDRNNYDIKNNKRIQNFNNIDNNNNINNKNNINDFNKASNNQMNPKNNHKKKDNENNFISYNNINYLNLNNEKNNSNGPEENLKYKGQKVNKNPDDNIKIKVNNESRFQRRINNVEHNTNNKINQNIQNYNTDVQNINKVHNHILNGQKSNPVENFQKINNPKTNSIKLKANNNQNINRQINNNYNTEKKSNTNTNKIININYNRKSLVCPSKDGNTKKRTFRGKYRLTTYIPVKYNTVPYFMLVENVRINNDNALKALKRGKVENVLNIVLDSLDFLSYVQK